MYCACAKRPFFHFVSKIWRHHRVPRLRCPKRRGNFGDSAINKGIIAFFLYCAYAKRPFVHFRSKIWRHHRVPRPRFPICAQEFRRFRRKLGQYSVFFTAHARNGHISVSDLRTFSVDFFIGNPVYLAYWPRKRATCGATHVDPFRQVWSWYDDPSPSSSVVGADTLRDYVTLTYDLLTLDSGQTWQITCATPPPSFKILRLSVLELWVMMSAIGHH